MNIHQHYAHKLRQGFTLVELLIVIAVISILAAVAFVAIDPATRINQAQDSERWSAVNAIMDAFLDSTVDNDGTYPAGVAADGTIHMISNGACTSNNYLTCPTNPTACTDFSALVTAGNIASLPVDPDGASSYGGSTGYTLSVAANGIVTVAACDDETDVVEVAR